MIVYCLVDSESVCDGIWNMMVSVDALAGKNGFDEEIPSKVKSALAAIGSTETSEAYYSVPGNLSVHLPHNPQMVVEGLNALVVSAGIDDVVFALCDVSKTSMKPARYYLVRYGYFVTAEQLNEEGRRIAPQGDPEYGGWVVDAEGDDGGTGICIYKLDGGAYHIGGWNYCGDEQEAQEHIDAMCVRETWYVGTIKKVYEYYIGGGAPEPSGRAIPVILYEPVL